MEEAASHDAPQTLPQALGRLRVALEDAFQRASRELGLTAQQAELLCAAMRPAAVGDLAHTLRCDRSNHGSRVSPVGQEPNDQVFAWQTRLMPCVCVGNLGQGVVGRLASSRSLTLTCR
jgi:hypothetical protein